MTYRILVALSIMLSFGLLLVATNLDIYAQMNQTAQDTNNQTVTSSIPATNQTEQSNQNSTQDQQQKQLNPTELLNSTNAAIIALSDDDTEEAQQILSQIQQQLINSLGKEVVVIPADALTTTSEE